MITHQRQRVFLYQFGSVATMGETGLHDSHILWKFWMLGQIAYAQVFTEDYFSGIIIFISADNIKEGTLALKRMRLPIVFVNPCTSKTVFAI